MRETNSDYVATLWEIVDIEEQLRDVNIPSEDKIKLRARKAELEKVKIIEKEAKLRQKMTRN